MIRINSKKAYVEFYYYKPPYGPKEFPKEYPCYCKQETFGGGIGGEYRTHYVCYIPKKGTLEEAFIAGLDPEWEKLD